MASDIMSEFLAAYNLVIHLVHQSPRRDAQLSIICENLSKPITSSPQNSTGLALNVLTTIFNTLPRQQATRYSILESILKVISSNSTFDSLRDQLENLDTWLSTWQISAQDQRKLFLAISDVASNATDEGATVQQYLVKALRTLQDPADSESPQARALSIRAIKAALQAPKTFDFQDLHALDSVQALHESDADWADLFDIFRSGTLDSYREFTSSHADFFSSSASDLDSDVLERKMRLLTLTSLCAGATSTQARSVPYSDISKNLCIQDADVELWIIDVVRAGLIEGKMSQSTKELLVHRATYRRFDSRQWRAVLGKLHEWKDSLVQVHRVIKAEREQFVAERETELRETDVASGKMGYRPARQFRSAVEVE